MINSYFPDIRSNTRVNLSECYQILKSGLNAYEQLYMIIDAANDERIYPALQASTNIRCCLFSEDNVPEEIKSVAPYLVKLKNMDEAMAWCLREGLHRNWMIFFTSEQQHITELKLHFKRFSIVLTPDGKECLFRYHDPRVLPAFLIASTPQERQKFFQHIGVFQVPLHSATEGTQILQFAEDGQQHLLNTRKSIARKDQQSWFSVNNIVEINAESATEFTHS